MPSAHVGLSLSWEVTESYSVRSAALGTSVRGEISISQLYQFIVSPLLLSSESLGRSNVLWDTMMGTKMFSKPRNSNAGRSMGSSKGESVFRTDIYFCPHCAGEMASDGPLTLWHFRVSGLMFAALSSGHNCPPCD